MFFPRIYGLNLVEEHQTHFEGHPRELKGCTLFIVKGMKDGGKLKNYSTLKKTEEI